MTVVLMILLDVVLDIGKSRLMVAVRRAFNELVQKELPLAAYAFDIVICKRVKLVYYESI